MNEPNLKPCPFCGYAAVLDECAPYKRSFIQCNCGIGIYSRLYLPSDSEKRDKLRRGLADKWNMRTL